MKRIASLLLAVVMVVCTGIYFPAETLAADVAWSAGGSGTSASPYIIDTAAEFTTFMTNVTSGSTYSGKYFRVDADIVYNNGFSFVFDEASGLVKVGNQSGTVFFCLGTGIPGTTYHRGYLTPEKWEPIGEVGKMYTAGSLTGALTVESAPSFTPSAWKYGNKDVSFAGVLDFNGHSISGVYANTTDSYVAIFSKMTKAATVKNMTVKNSYFAGGSRTAAIAGSIQANAKFYNCVSEAVVCGVGSYMGGIAGQSTGGVFPTFIGCENKGQVGSVHSESSTNSIVGGILGGTSGVTMIGCKNSGIVFAGGDYGMGGIIGLMDTGGKGNVYQGSSYVYGCINTGKVSSFYDNDTTEKYSPAGGAVGGIVGYFDPCWSNEGTVVEIKYCFNGGKLREGSFYSASTVANRRPGDIVGRANMVNHANLANAPCSATIRITDNLSVNDANSPIMINGSISGLYAYYTAENNDVIKTDDFRKDAIIYDFVDKANSFIAKQSAYSYIWYNGTDIEVVGYGKNVYDKDGYVDFKQDGTAEDPVIIDSLQDLKDLRDAVNGGKTYDGMHFAITCDIDLNPGTVFNADGTYKGAAPTVWEPIGNGVYGENPSVYFGGKLYGAKADGTPVIISGLYVNSSDVTLKPYAFIGINKGELSNVTFANASVNARRYAAIAVGENLGTVENCTTAENCYLKLNSHTAPTSIGNDGSLAPAGGICAANLGTVTGCKNSATVTSNYSHVGGIVGNNMGEVSYCTNYAAISGDCTVGGVVGHLYKTSHTYGTVSYSGNMGNVNATGTHAAGVVGWSRESGGISYCYNGGTVRSSGTSASSGQASSCVSGILGCGNANDLNSGNPYIVEYSYNVGDIYNSAGARTSNDIAGYLDSNSATRYLKATAGKSNNNGINDGVYLRILSGYDAYVPYLEDPSAMSYNANSELIAKSASFNVANGVTTLNVTFSEPVAAVRSSYAAIRFCTLNEEGVPSLVWKEIDGVSKPLQIDLSATFDDTNLVKFNTAAGFKFSAKIPDIIANAAEVAGFTGYVDGLVPLLCIEGLEVTTEGYTNKVGVLDTIKSIQVFPTYRGNHGLFTNYGVGTVTKADAKSGALCEFLNNAYGTNIYTQNIGVEDCPVIGGEIGFVKIRPDENGTYTTPALIGSINNAGSLIGYRDQDGNVYGSEEVVPYQYVSPIYENALVLKYGAAVRVGSNSVTGIRWTAKLNKNALEGYTIVDKGFIIAPTAYVTGEWAVVGGENVKAKKIADDFTAEAFDAVGIDYIDVKVTGFTDMYSTEFSASVSNLYEENFSLGYSARAYLDVKDASGNEKRLYSGFEGADGKTYFSYAESAADNSRAPGEIAKKALADLSSTQKLGYSHKISKAEDAYLTENGGTYTAEYYYSPYNQNARNNLYAFILDPVAEPEDERIFYPKYDNAEEYADMRAELKAWIMDQLESDAIFSVELVHGETKASGLTGGTVTLGGKNVKGGGTVSFATLAGRWQKSAISSVVDSKTGDETLTVTYTDDASGLRFVTTVILYGDTPTADIKTIVTNISDVNSLVIDKFYAIDASYPLANAGGDIKLTTLMGSGESVNDFDLVERDLTTEFVDGSASSSTTNTMFYPTVGFSSNKDVFPFFDLVSEKTNKGLMMAIGWSGTWEGSFKKDTSGNAIMMARQKYLRTFLHAGESVEAPRIVLTYFEGDREYGHNIWREMMLSHYTPDNDNDPTNEPNFVAPISANFWGGTYAETVKTSVQKYVEKGAPIDIVWFDAGWYGPLLYGSAAAFNENNPADVESWNDYIEKNPSVTFNSAKTAGASHAEWVDFRGDYIENKLLFPNGLEEIGKFVDDTNTREGTDLKFMLWYMLFDRHISHASYLYPGTSDEAISAGDNPYNILTEEEVEQYKDQYPGLANTDASDYIYGGRRLDLSNETTLQKMIAYFKYMKDVKGVDAIRLDNSYMPYQQWHVEDAEDQNADTSIPSEFRNVYEQSATLYTRGYTENKHTTNEYVLWDTLKEYSSDFFLDNTASGGRRLDIELSKRSISLWRSDFSAGSTVNGYEAHQKIVQNLALWIPLSTVGVANADDYHSRSYLSACMSVSGQGSWDTSTTKDANGNYLEDEGKERTSNAIVERVHEIADLRPYWYGNYYQLLPVTANRNDWQSYQLFREDWHEGFFTAICRPEVTQTEDPTGETLTKTIKLKGLNNCSMYLIHNIDDENGDRDIYASGAELMNNGVTVTGTQRNISIYKIILVD